MSTPITKRPNRQQVAAAATRLEILLAARHLFAEKGYTQTSIADIAEQAGVSIPTIYASVGPKPAIVSAIVELINLGIGGSEAQARLEVETDPAELIKIGPHLNRLLQEKFGDIVGSIRSAAEAEPDVAAAESNGRQMHRFGARRLAERLNSLEALRPGIDTDEAADVIDLLTDHQTFANLVQGYGWTFDRAEAWITSTLRTLLLSD